MHEFRDKTELIQCICGDPPHSLALFPYQMAWDGKMDSAVCQVSVQLGESSLWQRFRVAWNVIVWGRGVYGEVEIPLDELQSVVECLEPLVIE